MSSGAVGRGTYQSVIAGAVHRSKPTFYASSWELYLLRVQHRNVKQKIGIRDAVFHNRFPHAAAVNGHFRLTPGERHQWHSEEVMPAIRKRTMLIQRINRQRQLNASIPEAELREQMEKLKTPDLALYTNPKAHKGTVAQMDFWNHKEYKHLVPRTRWERHPELGNITRVHDRIPNATAYTAVPI